MPSHRDHNRDESQSHACQRSAAGYRQRAKQYLCVFVVSGCRFYTRWKEWESWYSQSFGLHFSLQEEQWQEDWAFILSLASQVHAQGDKRTHSLDGHANGVRIMQEGTPLLTQYILSVTPFLTVHPAWNVPYI